MAIKQTVYEVLIIVIISIMISFTVNAVRPQGISFSDKSSDSSQQAKGPAEISVDEAVQRFKAGKTLFTDSRSSDDYAAGHIKGAVNLPDHEFDAFIDKFLSETEPETEIVTYCDGQNCSLCEDLAEKLFSAGFEHIFYIKNGLTLWREGGHPVEQQ